ncbi:glycoside hydrolase family 32 protein, partial [Neolentinus lepideus HHB14362 ss-1]
IYLLAISCYFGAPLGGSVSQYIPGSFSGTHLTPTDGATHLSDFGKDSYIGQFSYGSPSTEQEI